MSTPPSVKLALDQAGALLARGDYARALEITAPLARDGVSVNALGMHAAVLKALGRREEALAADRRAVAQFPHSGVAWHNLAATLGDLGRGAEVKAAAEQAFARGLDAPQTWLVYARALVAIGDFDAGAQAYRETLKRTPGDVVVASELAELHWTAWGDLDRALAVLEEGGRAGGEAPALALRRAGLLQAAGQGEAARAVLTAAARRFADPAVQIAAADALLKAGRAAEGLPIAQAAAAAAPGRPGVLAQLAALQMALGEGAEALATARRGLQIAPLSQGLLACAETAGRLAGDAEAEALCDYQAMVGEHMIEHPDGWPTLEAYLADLAAALRGIHAYQRHPSDQSLHGGSQTTYLLTGSAEPAIQAFFRAVDAPIRAHMAALGQGDDPLRRRNSGAYRIHGAWSVRLRPGGYHRDHFHSEGWLSSAFYVETPEAALARGHEGWLRLGCPPFPTAPPLEPRRYVRPAPGKLVLFPSYMWHGTEPFTTDEARMTIAFDVVPA